MDYPFYRKQRYDISNNWWFLPNDLFKIEQDRNEIGAQDQDRTTSIVSYMNHISNKNKFKYLVIIIVIIVFIYRLDLHSSIWVGLVIGLVIVYYSNEDYEQTLDDNTHQIWDILKGPLLKNTKYFINDPSLTQWVNDVGEFKKYNILVFNQMIKTLDHMLRLSSDIKKGVHYCAENLDIIKDLKTSSLNQFHSIVHNITAPVMRHKLNYYLEEFAKLLNTHMAKLIKVCQLYYMNTPTSIDSHFGETTLADPTPFDPFYEKAYNFYN